MCDHPRLAEQQQDRLFRPLVHHDLTIDHLGDALLPTVEQVDRLRDHRRSVRVVRVDLIAVTPEILDLDTQISHDTGRYRHDRPAGPGAVSQARHILPEPTSEPVTGRRDAGTAP